MIRTELERARLKSRLMSWRRMEKHLVSLFGHWNMDEPDLLNHIAGEMESMENQLQLYARRFADSDESKIDAPHLPLNIENLGSDLIQMRVSLGWSQGDLAQAARIRQQQISRYEVDSYAHVNVCTVQRIAAVLISEIKRAKAAMKNAGP